MSNEDLPTPDDDRAVGFIPDHVDREQPWWLLIIDLHGPHFHDIVKVESNNMSDLLPKVVDLNFEEYGDDEGRVQVRQDQVVKRTYMHVLPEEMKATPS